MGEGLSDELRREVESYYFKEFEAESKRSLSFMEKLYHYFGFLSIDVGEEERVELVKKIKALGLRITPEQVKSASLIVALIFIVLTIVGFLLSTSLMVLTVGLVVTLLAYRYVSGYVNSLFNSRRLKSSTELVMSVMYMVIYMRHTPNLENAVKYASTNLSGPLGVDFKKMVWDVQNKKVDTMEDALSSYLTNWSETNPEYVDAVNLIISSTYQTSESHRLDLLNKSLDRMLQGTLETMTHYANSLKNPIEAVYLLGITLPIFNLITMPIIGAFLGELISSRTLATLYNVLLPVGVLLMIENVLKNRPVAFSHPDLSGHPDLPRNGFFKWKGLEVPIIPLAVLVFVIGLVPFLFYLQVRPFSGPSEWDVYVSLLPIIGLSGAVYVYSYLSVFQRLKLRDEIERLESEFSNITFQLSNKVSEGVPLESAFLKLAETSKASVSSKFFKRLAYNIQELGLSVDQAIFDEKYGVLVFFPSNLVKASMRILVESASKSLSIAGASMRSVSQYLRNVHIINEKIKDVLSETLSSLNFQSTIVAPLISGIVVGLTSMIMTILSTLDLKLSSLQAQAQSSGGLNVAGAWSIGFFNIKSAIPLYWFQLIVGLYFIQVVVLMVRLGSQVEFAGDSLMQKAKIGRTILISTIVYVVVAVGVTVLFGGLANFAVAITG